VPKSGSADTKPKLVVLIVIDQWPSWIVQEQKHLYTGGIARLLRDGAVVDDAEITYANTFTAPGHATIGSGTTPREHGIVGNYWYRRTEGRDRPAEYDVDSQPLPVGPALGGAEISADDGASGKALRVEGIADALEKGTQGAGVSVSISLKSRSACLLTGRQPDLAIWYEPGAGGMTTSSKYIKVAPIDAPRWLKDMAKSAPASRYFDSVWTPRDRELLAKGTKVPDDARGEDSNHGLGRAFPHKLAGNEKVAFAIQETPFADELVTQTVAVALDEMKLGQDEVPDLLAISYSAHDYAGHSWGQESWEVLDLTLRLDAQLGELFASLDAKLGEHQWAAVLTSDHGATPLIERSASKTARRIPSKEIEDAAQDAIQAETQDPGPWVVKLVTNNLYLTAKFAELPTDVRLRAIDAAAKSVAAVPGIGGAMRTDLFDPTCKDERDLERVICEAVIAGEAGELFVWPDAGNVVTNNTFGTGHDSPSADTLHVPIIVMAPGVTPQHGSGTTLQIAPTVAALLGVDPPSAAKASPLFGIERR